MSSKKIADVVNAAKSTTTTTYHEWMNSLSPEQRREEYERASTSVKHRLDHEKASEVNQRLADLGENPLPDSLIGVRFTKRKEESTEYDSQLGYEAFTVVGLQGRHGDADMDNHVSHRFILLQLDNGEITIVDVGGFFAEIMYSYSVDVAAKQRAAVDAVAFVPPYLVGKTFRFNKDAKDRNWFGYDEFTVVGDAGPWVVPGRETASGSPYVMTGQVCVEVEGSLMTLMRSEFLDLTGTAKRLYKLVK
jgi:hypothetical protein